MESASGVTNPFRAEFFNILAHHPIIETDLLGDLKDRMLAFKAHHDLFDGAVERPVIAPVHPETMPLRKTGPRKVRLGM
jgi:hypothetical protein